MTVFTALNQIAEEQKLGFLVIGGHAVNAYGYSRFTKDLDLLVSKADRDAWISGLAHAGFKLENDGEIFLQMEGGEFRWPLDLMLVPEPTFQEMHRQSRSVPMGSADVRIPSLEHLFALKFHVLKQELPRRGFKDFLDVISLADYNSVDLKSDKIRLLCEKYGSSRIYERLLAFQ